MWYYTLNGQQTGPISQEELEQKFESGLSASTLVWKQGMPDWTKASELDTFSSTTADGPPPLTSNTTSIDPYSPPLSSSGTNSITEDYPLPPVKKASFGLLIGVMTFAFIALIGVFAAFFINLMTITEMELEAANSNQPIVHEHASHGEAPHTPTETFQDFSSDIDVASEIFSPAMFLSLGLCLGAGMWATILSMSYLHRAWRVLQPAGASTTPGKAVGFMFIPLFNYYWTFIAYWKWAEEWNYACGRYRSLQSAPAAGEGSFLAMSICQCVGIVFSPASLGQIVLYFVGMKSMCDVVNYAAENSKDSSAIR